MVAFGRVRKQDMDRNDAVDGADLGRLRQQVGVVNIRRDLLRVKKE